MDKRTIVAIDCGQAVTQAALFESVGLSLRLLGQASAPSTPGAPDGLATGVRAALAELQLRTGAMLMDDSGLPLGNGGLQAPHAWILTTDSGGAVRAAVAGVIDDISGQSAMKAALGAGAAVSDLLAINDGRPDHHKARDLRQNPADLILLAGGVDEGLFAEGGGRQVVNMAATIALAAPRPRFDPQARMPLVFAGSAEARQDVADKLGTAADVTYADNVRPDLAFENLDGARKAILDVFRTRIVPRAHAYRALAPWLELGPLLPTGMAAGAAAALLAGAWKEDILVADLGEVSVNIYSVIGGELNRTTIDQFGYNKGGALSMAGLAEAAENWIPLEMSREEVANVLSVQRSYPAALPLSWDELCIQQAAAKERLRCALVSHRQLVALLKGIHRQRNIDEVLGAYVAMGGQTMVDLLRVNQIVATGRLVAGATEPGQVAAMVIDGLQPQGLTQLLADGRNLLGHLGAIAEQDSRLAAQMLGDGWLSRLGLVVSPVPRERGGPLFRRLGSRMARVRIERQDGSVIRDTVDYGTVKRVPLDDKEIARVTVWPDRRHNVGSGYGFPHTMSGGGILGVILDGRGRPIMSPQNPARRRARLAVWLGALGAYPEDLLKAASRGEGS
jgi:hypothetical protein